jgi:energy-coupling factor transporter ATP-binding protein EcfA2
MRWITYIELNNYRAFNRQYKAIEIPANHHVLIYGENGSGKSSIYNALKDFLSSAANTTQQFELNLFSQKAGNNNGSITIKIAELDTAGTKLAENPFVFAEPDSQSTHRIPQIQLANKVKGFIDYKRLLKTHFGETQSGQNPNLFSLIVENLLADHLIKRPVGGGVSDFPLLDEWKRIRDNILKLDGRFSAYHAALAELPAFENALKQLLINVFTEFKRLVQTYFDKKLEINVRLSQLEFERVQWQIKQELFFDIKYAGEAISSYQTFINEARLSALGICLYLAAIKTYPPTASDLKILYLDDVFIGLDTSNRIPLLKIIKNEFINQDFQIFISTYDRQWFETSRIWFEAEKCKFKCLELFVNDDDGNPSTPDVPIVIDPSHNLFEKAISHFEAKDFPAAANYLRRNCEAELRKILPRNLTLNINQTNGEKTIHKLEKLVDNFFGYLTKNGLNTTPFTHFKTYKKIILNPLSHDDTEAPHYRKEIQDGIALVGELQKISTKEIISAKDSAINPMKLRIIDVASGGNNDYEIVILEDLYIIKQDLAPIQLSVVECEVFEAGKRNFTSLQAAFDTLWIERGNLAPTNYAEFYNHIKVSNKNKLIDLMTF